MNDIIFNQVINLIIKAINRFAKKLSANPGDIQLYIVSENNEGYPKLKLLHKGIFVRDLNFLDLVNAFERVTYSAMGFDIQNDMPVWIQKFILKSANDTGLEILKSSYVIVSVSGNLKSFMYFEGKQYKEVAIDYILETK